MKKLTVNPLILDVKNNSVNIKESRAMTKTTTIL